MDVIDSVDARPMLRVRLVRDDVPEGEIALADLARIAKATQKFVRQIARSLVGQTGPGASRKAVADASTLSLVGLKRGSTVLEIAGAERTPDVLEYNIPTDLTEMTFDLMVSGVSAAADTEFIHPELPIGFDKALANDLDEWLTSVRTYSKVEVESNLHGHSITVSVAPAAARQHLTELVPQPAMPFISPTEQELVGRLYALNLNTGAFSIEDDAGHKIRLRVPPELRSDAALLVDRRVRAAGQPELDETGRRLRSFGVTRFVSAPDIPGLPSQESFFEPQQLEPKRPPGSGSLDDWAIDDLTEEEGREFMAALESLR